MPREDLQQRFPYLLKPHETIDEGRLASPALNPKPLNLFWNLPPPPHYTEHEHCLGHGRWALVGPGHERDRGP